MNHTTWEGERKKKNPVSFHSIRLASASDSFYLPTGVVIIPIWPNLNSPSLLHKGFRCHRLLEPHRGRGVSMRTCITIHKCRSTRAKCTLIGCQDLLSPRYCCGENNDDMAEHTIPPCCGRKGPACHSRLHRCKAEPLHPLRHPPV